MREHSSHGHKGDRHGFRTLIRLEKSRRELHERQRIVEQSSEAQLGELLLPALQTALATLRQLHDDDALSDAARGAVTSLRFADLAQARADYARSLPPLVYLFGYAVPPPPSAQQLVSDTVSLLDKVDDVGATVLEIEEARGSLDGLLERTEHLAQEPPWKVLQTTAEVNSFVQLDVEVTVGAAPGAIAGAFAGVMVGAVTGGAVPAAGCIVLGAIRRFNKVREYELEIEQFAEANRVLTAAVFPAAGEVVAQYLDQVLTLSVPPGSGEPDATVKVSAILDSIVNISLRFVLKDPRRIALIRQAGHHHNHLPIDLLPLLCQVHDAADRARTERSSHGSIADSSLSQLGQLRDKLREKLP